MRQGMDPDTRRLTLFAGGLGAVLAVLIGASALVGHHGDSVPVVLADNRPIRVKPDNPGGMKIDGAENDVFSGGSDTADSKLAPAPESPDTKALRSAAAVIPPPVPRAETPLAAAPLAAAPLAASPLTTAAVIVPPAIAPSQPAKIAAAPSKARPVPGTEAAHPPVAGRRTMVQLAALGSEEAARNEWQVLSKRMPGLLNGHQPDYSRTEHDGRTFWRVRTAGFADIARARDFCDQVRQKGGGCSVADF